MRIICDKTYSHSLKIIFVALTQFAGDHGFGLTHVIDCALNCNDAFEVKTVNVVDTTNSDFRVGVLHDSFNCVAALSDNSTNKIIVCEDLQSDLPVDKIYNNIIAIQL